MLVRVSAFEMAISSDMYDLRSFVGELTARSGQEYKGKIFYFDASSFDDFCVGVIITVKDQSKFCKLKSQADGSAKISVSNLEEAEKIMDFNFFAINLENGVGVYQGYHQAPALKTLSNRFKSVAKELRDNYVADGEAALHQSGRHTAAAVRRLKREARIRVGANPIISTQDLERRLAAYRKIKGLEYTYTVLVPRVAHATPLSDKVKKKRETLFFTNPNLVTQLAHEISLAIQDFAIRNGRVIVEDEDEDVKSVKIFEMPEVLWEEEYDVVVTKIDDIDPGDFAANKYLNEIMALFDKQEYAAMLRAAFDE